VVHLDDPTAADRGVDVIDDAVGRREHRLALVLTGDLVEIHGVVVAAGVTVLVDTVEGACAARDPGLA
jgi:hypothetical protein